MLPGWEALDRLLDCLAPSLGGLSTTLGTLLASKLPLLFPPLGLVLLRLEELLEAMVLRLPWALGGRRGAPELRDLEILSCPSC